ncbi:MAG: hydrolase [Candidatus Gastranaerophilaceae bacterium]
MNTLNQNDCLLILIDIQEKLVAMLEKNTVVKQSTILLKAANILNIPSIVTEQYPQGLGSTVDYLQEQIKDKNEIFEKTAFSAVKDDGFLDKVKSYGKKQIIIGGIESHICVHQTVADLLENGFEVYVVKDACASRKKDNFKNAIRLMRQNGAKIADTEIVLFELLKTSKHPNFKEIQALIK